MYTQSLGESFCLRILSQKTHFILSLSASRYCFRSSPYLPVQNNSRACAFLAEPPRGEIKKMQKRRKASRRRTGVRQRRVSAVEKAKTLFHLLKESARIPTSFRKSNYTKAVFKKLVFAFSVCAFLAFTQRGEIKKMQKRRNTTRRRTGVRQRRVSAVEKAKTSNLMQESARIPTHYPPYGTY